tara:strand:+ start:1715 stop:1978 length:264 start_codon:yes stop_codon:yes gene_type:complete
MAQIILELIRFNEENNGIDDLIPIISGKVKQKYDIASNLIKFHWKIYKKKGPLYHTITFDFVECENCGNVWDGNAQCGCFGLYFDTI